MSFSIQVLLSGALVSWSIDLGFPLGPVTLSVDPLSAFFLLLIAAGNFLVGIYSIGYFRSHTDAKKSFGYYIFLALLFLSMFILVTVRHAIAFLFIWEIMSLSSFFLVMHEHETLETRNSALYYLIAMQLGFIFILAAFLLCSLQAGSFDFKDFSAVFQNSGTVGFIAFLLFFIGFGTKSGFVPFHTWLPKAHPAAPSPVSAAMSGIMIKTGIYGILRIIMFMGKPPLSLSILVLGVSLVSAVLGVLSAIAQHDLKKLLAYHSIENIGIIGIGIGLGMLGLSLDNPVLSLCGFAGGLLHVANHFLFKSLLFFGAGAVYRETGTRNVDFLGGVAKTMPVTGLFFLIGSIAISGLPPLNGFVSEFMIYFGFLKGITGGGGLFPVLFIIALALLALTGVLALFCFTKVFGIVFLGRARDEEKRARQEAPLSLLFPMGLITLFIFAIGLFPDKAFLLLKETVLSLGNMKALPAAAEALPASLSSLSTALLVFAGMFVGVVLLRFFLVPGKRRSRFKTWDCGYQASSPRSQYTSSSFADSLMGVFGRLLRYKVTARIVDAGTNMSGRTVSVTTETSDVIDRRAVTPLSTLFEKILRFFLWIQSGNTQQYILYGILFLLALIFLVIGGVI
jgi:hydrogenase-4 component B